MRAAKWSRYMRAMRGNTTQEEDEWDKWALSGDELATASDEEWAMEEEEAPPGPQPPSPVPPRPPSPVQPSVYVSPATLPPPRYEGIRAWQEAGAETQGRELGREAGERMSRWREGAVEDVDVGTGELEGVEVAYWNTRMLNSACSGVWTGKAEESRSAKAKRAEEFKVAMRKLEFLEAQLVAMRPAVVFLSEVAGTRPKWCGGLRRWLLLRGYHGQIVPGPRGVNGMVVAVHKEQCDLKQVRRPAERVVEALVKIKGERAARRLVYVHGFNKETLAENMREGVAVERCFAQQLQAAEECAGEGGGVVMGDFNRVLCARWRSGGHSLTADDRRLRRAVGWTCECCGDGRSESGGLVMGDERPTRCSPCGSSNSRIDWAFCVGREVGKWRALRGVEAKDHQGVRVSDHDLMVLRSERVKEVPIAARRPTPIPIGRTKGNAAVRRRYQEGVSSASFARQVGESTAEAVKAGGSELAAVRSAYVEAGRDAVLAEKRTRWAEGATHAWRKKGQTPHQRFQQWAARLAKVMKGRQSGGHPMRVLQVEVAHCKRLKEAARRWQGCEEAWREVVHTCRRELRNAGRASEAERRAEDKRLRELAQDVSKPQVDALVRMQKVWRMLRESRASAAMEAVWEGDVKVDANKDPEGARRRKIEYKDQPEKFLRELDNIGKKTVEKFADTPACVPAFRAWCDLFMESWEEISGTQGGRFDLEKELTWEIFLEVLFSMPSGKAVGAGGFHAELLWAAGENAQRAFYHAMMADLKRDVMPEEWHQVIYSLLVKPWPNDKDLVEQRRDIALMAHDMKLFLQMVRRVAYQRVVGRIMSSQAGWLAGYGCSDPSLVVAITTKQAVRLQRDRYMLFIDLATFFPRCDREVITVAEALHGLPKQVSQLAVRIFGCATKPDEAVVCRYDSAGGLSHGFRNHMGALMGCVLSPDKAKILLNSVVVAIQATVKGVRLWGHGRGDDEDSWRRVAQAAYADDWAGCFGDEEDLRRAWAIWRTWEMVSGSKLGVKKKLKTVVTGVRWVEGVAHDPADPRLRLKDGSYVPFMRHSEAYKHLGNWRRADGVDDVAWVELKQKMDVALRRLRKMVKPSVNEFINASNTLIGGLGGYYLQTLYITFEQAEKVESQWRAIYRTKFGHSYEEAYSKPRAFYYQPRGKGTRRLHLWGVGLAALYTCFGDAVADVADTPQRAAARSEIALALERWGCCAKPREWRWGHLAGALEANLRKQGCRQLGDAWMLAATLMEKEHTVEWERVEGSAEVSAWARDFGGERMKRWGRWKGEVGVGDPMHDDAPHWVVPASALLFEPVETGGLGLAPEADLLNAGVKAVGHMCATLQCEGVEKHVFMSAGEARWRHRRWGRKGQVAAAWDRVRAKLREMQVEPVHGEKATAVWGEPITAVPTVRCNVDFEQVDRLLAALAVDEVRARRRSEIWATQLARCFQGVEKVAAVEWEHGGRDRKSSARGARYVLVHGEPSKELRWGGEARWLRRKEAGYQPPDGDEVGIAVGEDGWCEGWMEEATKLYESVTIDAQGFVCDKTGERVTGEALGELLPALQMQARARLQVAEAAPEHDVEVEWPAMKYKKTTVNLAVQRSNHREMCKWQARIRATAVYSVDGSRKMFQRQALVARAAVRHDGVVIEGGMHEPEGADNYLAELAAQIDAAHDADEGARIIVVFDATSPIAAMHKYQRQCHRKRQRRFAGEWLEALSRLTSRLEVVVFLWQRSHYGSPVNEWADLAAEAAMHGAAEQEFKPVRRVPFRSGSLCLTMPARSTFGWATPLAATVVQKKLAETVVDSQMHGEFDLPRLTLADDVQRTCEAVASERSCIGDPKLLVGRARVRLVGKAFCPFGCEMKSGERARFTWWHAQLFCAQCDLVEARRGWVEEMETADKALVHPGTMLQHAQIQSVLTLAREGLPRTRDGKLPPEGATSKWARVKVQRFVAGMVQPIGDKKLDKSLAVRMALRTAITAGARVQQKAHELTKVAEQRVREEGRTCALVAKYARVWRERVIAGGPARAAALQEVRVAEAVVTSCILHTVESGLLDVDGAADMITAVSTTGDSGVIVLDSHVARSLREERVAWPRRGMHGCWSMSRGDAAGSVYWQWRILALMQRWRLVARLRVARRCAAKMPKVVECEREREVDQARRLDAAVTGCLRTHRVPARAVQGRESSGIWIAGVVEVEAAAAAKWMAGGGWRGEKRRRAAWRAALRASKAAAVRMELKRSADGMMRYLKQKKGGGPGSLIGISGNILGGDGANRRHVSILIEPRVKRRRRGGCDGETGAKSAFESGTAPNRRSEWAVECVLEVRRPRGGERRGGRELEARLRWVGVHPTTGLPWKDSWVPRRVQVETERGGKRWVHMFGKMVEEEAAALERLKYGAGVAGVADTTVEAADGDVGESKVAKWRAALRSTAEVTRRRREGRAWWRLRPCSDGVGVHVSESEESDGEHEVECEVRAALRDAARRRERGGDLLAGWQRRDGSRRGWRRRSVVEDGSSSEEDGGGGERVRWQEEEGGGWKEEMPVEGGGDEGVEMEEEVGGSQEAAEGWLARTLRWWRGGA